VRGDRTLGKVADMQTKLTDSPVRGVIAEPIRVHDDTAAANNRDGVTIDTAPPRRTIATVSRSIRHRRADATRSPSC
jgi:hypothetical protein